ncbi:MAG: PTS sugar transporter subunit IIA [Phycisphaerae bacterium]|jgi:mannitol/fructose-specific phosphotransferase system IIA component (Ntr-type)|nr:PTS sugar transporter subunit IIA [Phycisphaerae bacterium]
MPHEQMNAAQVATYLAMDLREVIKLASRGQIPCRKLGGDKSPSDRFRFIKSEVDHWIETQMHTLNRQRLASIAKSVSDHHGLDSEGMLLCSSIPDGGVDVPMHARTREATIRELVDVADRAGMVYLKAELLEEIREREDVCSTALIPGVALPHPRHPVEYDIVESFVVVGLTHSGIPFGAPDGSLTRLFFLVCCKDERTHLHLLARLAQMLHTPGVLDELMAAEAPDTVMSVLQRCEKAIINGEI